MLYDIQIHHRPRQNLRFDVTSWIIDTTRVDDGALMWPSAQVALRGPDPLGDLTDLNKTNHIPAKRYFKIALTCKCCHDHREKVCVFKSHVTISRKRTHSIYNEINQYILIYIFSMKWPRLQQLQRLIKQTNKQAVFLPGNTKEKESNSKQTSWQLSVCCHKWRIWIETNKQTNVWPGTKQSSIIHKDTMADRQVTCLPESGVHLFPSRMRRREEKLHSGTCGCFKDTGSKSESPVANQRTPNQVREHLKGRDILWILTAQCCFSQCTFIKDKNWINNSFILWGTVILCINVLPVPLIDKIR